MLPLRDLNLRSSAHTKMFLDAVINDVGQIQSYF